MLAEFKQVSIECGTPVCSLGVPVVSSGVITRVAVVPHPPLLVPELVAGADGATADVRDAVTEAACWLRQSSTRWIAVGAHHGPPARFGPSAAGSFAGYGVDVRVSLSRGASEAGVGPLPLPVLVAGWLRERADAESVRCELVSASTAPSDCVAIGRLLREETDDVGLLVLGDGSNRHGPRAPGQADERATGFDASVASALADADGEGLLELDPSLASELGAIGRAAWQVAAGLAGEGTWHGKLVYSGAPFGVGYHVAVWEAE